MDIKYFSFLVAIFACQAWVIHSQCEQVNLPSGELSYTHTSQDDDSFSKCWRFPVPANEVINISVEVPKFSYNCNYGFLRVTMGTREKSEFCFKRKEEERLSFIPTANDAYVEVKMYFYPYGSQKGSPLSFRVKYIVATRISDIKGVPEARMKAINWLISKRTPNWGWKENTARAVTSLFLAGGANFNGTILQEELMAKQTELKVAAALFRKSITTEELSMYIHALLVTCNNPRRFYGHNLLKRLKKQVQSSGNFTHPLAYLALCNAHEEWPSRANEDLKYVLESVSKHPFYRDIKAFAIMAISCKDRQTEFLNKTENVQLKHVYQQTVRDFKKYQTSDGSFGNAESTALITQALLSSGQEIDKDWNLNKTIQYLIRELNSSSVDFITTYLALPIFNAKSLSNIAEVNCSANPRKIDDEDIVTEIDDFLGSKINVEYSLFVGNEKDIVHSISLRVPEKFTAFEVMKLAEEKDPKYKFQWKRVSGQLYVYEISKISNDPAKGKFWLMYMGSANNTEEFEPSTSDPDQQVLDDGDHLVMWYRTPSI